MKQLLTGVLLSALISISLVGCTAAETKDAAQTTDEPTVEESTTSTYTSDLAAFSLEYPKAMHIDVSSMTWGEPELYIEFGDEYSESGYLLRIIQIRSQRDDYEEYMTENADGPYFPIQNACEVDEATGGQAFDCEKLSDNVTKYKMVESMGDIGLVQKYYIYRPDSDWPVMEMKVDLMTDDFMEQFDRFDYKEIEQAFRDGPLTPQQKERADLVDAMYKSLKLK